MARSGFKVMDSDMHVIEPIDLWQTYMDPDFRDRAPKGVTRFQGDMMMEVSGQNVPYWMPSKRYFDWQKKTAEDQDAAYKYSYEREIGTRLPRSGPWTLRDWTSLFSTPAADSTP